MGGKAAGSEEFVDETLADSEANATGGSIVKSAEQRVAVGGHRECECGYRAKQTCWRR